MNLSSLCVLMTWHLKLLGCFGFQVSTGPELKRLIVTNSAKDKGNGDGGDHDYEYGDGMMMMMIMMIVYRFLIFVR